MELKAVAITMGEPGGIGPEVIAKALGDPAINRSCYPVIIGDASIMEDAFALTRSRLSVRKIYAFEDAVKKRGVINVFHTGSRRSAGKGGPSKNAGKSVIAFIKSAVELALHKKVHAIVTAPISKESLHMAGAPWPGHTEMLAGLTGTRDVAMMFVSRKLKVILCTIHIPLRKVAAKISKHLVRKTIRLAIQGTAMCGIRNPRIAVAGLNPHAGEAGIMGDEEIKSIIPAVRETRAEGIAVSGPYPPDVIFHRAVRGEFDIVVSMYHDQGLIPFKMLSFETGVNMTVGLPIIRTSPDHGTGFDIAWQNRANPASMLEAILLACRLKIDGQ